MVSVFGTGQLDQLFQEAREGADNFIGRECALCYDGASTMSKGDFKGNKVHNFTLAWTPKE
jgi:hypothetical protein